MAKLTMTHGGQSGVQLTLGSKCQISNMIGVAAWFSCRLISHHATGDASKEANASQAAASGFGVARHDCDIMIHGCFLIMWCHTSHVCMSLLHAATNSCVISCASFCCNTGIAPTLRNDADPAQPEVTHMDPEAGVWVSWFHDACTFVGDMTLLLVLRAHSFNSRLGRPSKRPNDKKAASKKEIDMCMVKLTNHSFGCSWSTT